MPAPTTSSSRLGSIFSKLPRFAQVLVEDTHRLNEYPRFMRLAMSFGTVFFLYKFAQTMQYLESEKHAESPDQRAARREQEKHMRDQLTQDAMASTQIIPPSDEHIRAIIERANKNKI